jgi:NADH-quinone oxidoreductase subunit J
MEITFYIAGAVAILATLGMLTRLHAVHALLYLVVSLLSVAVVFYVLGAPFIAALEVIIYAGAIMVLFVFVVMLMNLGPRAVELERQWMSPGAWVGPMILAVILIAEVAYLLSRAQAAPAVAGTIGPKQVGLVLFGPYLIGVELASILLLGALVGAYHLGTRKQEQARTEKHDGVDSHATRVAAGGDLVRTGADRAPGAS